MPRELLLPIPHAIADKVHHLFLAKGQDLFADKHFTDAKALFELADKLDALAREAGVIGW